MEERDLEVAEDEAEKEQDKEEREEAMMPIILLGIIGCFLVTAALLCFEAIGRVGRAMLEIGISLFSACMRIALSLSWVSVIILLGLIFFALQNADTLFIPILIIVAVLALSSLMFDLLAECRHYFWNLTCSLANNLSEKWQKYK